MGGIILPDSVSIVITFAGSVSSAFTSAGFLSASSAGTAAAAGCTAGVTALAGELLTSGSFFLDGRKPNQNIKSQFGTLQAM